MAHMKRRYEATLYAPRGNHSALVATRSFRTLEGAIRQVERWLAKRPVRTTRANYHRDVQRAHYGRIADLRLDASGRILARGAYADANRRRLHAPVDIVPSVGELGYW